MIAAVLLAAGLIANTSAGGRPPDEHSSDDSPPRVVVGDVGTVKVAAGGRATVRLPIRVANGHRVQANPASNEFLVPLKFEVEEIDGLEIGPRVYQEGEPYVLEGSDKPLMTYVGEFEIIVPVFADEDAKPGEYRVSGELHYQACNSRLCLFPASLPVEIRIVVSAWKTPDTLETSQ
jgi:hypothetical protein